jgi:hypothetical protein
MLGTWMFTCFCNRSKLGPNGGATGQAIRQTVKGDTCGALCTLLGMLVGSAAVQALAERCSAVPWPAVRR